VHEISLWLGPDPMPQAPMVAAKNQFHITRIKQQDIVPTFFFPFCNRCKWNNILSIWMPLWNLGAVGLLMIIRVCTPDGNRKLFIWSLRGLWVYELSVTFCSKPYGLHYSIWASIVALIEL